MRPARGNDRQTCRHDLNHGDRRIGEPASGVSRSKVVREHGLLHERPVNDPDLESSAAKLPRNIRIHFPKEKQCRIKAIETGSDSRELDYSLFRDEPSGVDHAERLRGNTKFRPGKQALCLRSRTKQITIGAQWNDRYAVCGEPGQIRGEVAFGQSNRNNVVATACNQLTECSPKQMPSEPTSWPTRPSVNNRIVTVNNKTVVAAASGDGT